MKRIVMGVGTLVFCKISTAADNKTFGVHKPAVAVSGISDSPSSVIAEETRLPMPMAASPAPKTRDADRKACRR